MAGRAIPWDRRLLEGVTFRCRPNCALCCFATPGVTPGERARLLTLEPDLELLEDGDWVGLAAAPSGGACGLLSERRCRGHAARPSPCRLYPLHVHLGRTTQASVVLSCPGVATPWLPDVDGSPGPSRSDDGLAEERAWLAERLAAAQLSGEIDRARQDVEASLTVSGGATDADLERAFRARLARAPPPMRDVDYPPPPGPSEVDGVELLPIFQDPAHGTVAIASVDGAAELLRVDPGGGTESLATYPALPRRPALTPEGGATLRAYLAYSVRRDAMADIVRLEWLESGAEGSLEDAWVAEIRRTTALVLERGYLRALLNGRPGRTLDAADVTLGIRAVDSDLLDRPGIGTNLV